MATGLPDIIADNIEAIRAICRQYDVTALYLFGSSAKGTFDPRSSDIDLQVDLGRYEPGVSTRYVGMYQALSALLSREIDLITTQASGNEAFMRDVIASRRAIYVG